MPIIHVDERTYSVADVRKLRADLTEAKSANADFMVANVHLLCENDRLRSMLQNVVHRHGGTHSEDCHAYGANDDDVESDGDGESPDPWCDCGALKIRNDARALLAGQPDDTKENG